MSKNTHALVILDRSGSMNSIKGAMEEAYDGWVRDQKNDPSGNLTVTLVQFDARGGYGSSWYEEVYSGLSVNEVPRLKIVPRGGTALYDAIGTAITDIDRKIEQSLIKPDQNLVIIITDGDENSSVTYNVNQVKALIETHQGRGWNFTYLGANQDSFANAGAMGIHAHSVMDFNPTAAGVRGMANSLATYTSNVRTFGNASYTDTDRESAKK